MQDDILQALSWRYAVKTFDPESKISDSELKTILESGRLAPSSFGIEPWKFIVPLNKDLRLKMRAASYDQSKVSDASHIIVIARRTDVRENIARELSERTAKARGQDVSETKGLRDAVAGAIGSKSDAELDAWVRAQVYIPLGMMLETAALLGVDAGPMEGFSTEKIDEILSLKEKYLTATTILALGRRGKDSAALLPKTRRDASEVVEFIE